MRAPVTLALALLGAAAPACGSGGSGGSPSGATGSAGSGGTAVAADAGVRPRTVTAGCRDTLARLDDVALDARPIVILNACEVCGPWQPLLDWRRTHPQGGPTRGAIEDAMIGCDGFCDAGAKDRFLGTLDDARGTDLRTPWRQLAEVCKGKVSALPDARHASATLFALDRVARALGSGAPGVDVPLPAVSISGVGVELPRSTAVDASAPPVHVTVTANEVRTGALPRARLTADGVAVVAGADYPGALLDEAKAKLPDVVIVVAPAKLSAHRVAEAIRGLTASRITLAAAVDGPDGWQLVGSIPVSLVDPAARPSDAHAEIALTGEVGRIADPEGKPVHVVASSTATVADLADLLTKLHDDGVKQITLHPKSEGPQR